MRIEAGTVVHSKHLEEVPSEVVWKCPFHGNLGAALQSWCTCFFSVVKRGKGSLLRIYADARCLRRHLCKPRLCSEHMCPCALEVKWGPKINTLRTPKKCRVKEN